MSKYFETEKCSRCQGSGNYSYCERFGTICFKCHGNKVVLTKRGATASEYLRKLRTKSASALVVGDRIASDRMTDGGSLYTCIATVTKIESTNSCQSGTTENGVTVWKTHEMIAITSNHPKYGDMTQCCVLDTPMRVYAINDAEKIKQAVEYQNTLTKQGKPRKSKVKKEVLV